MSALANTTWLRLRKDHISLKIPVFVTRNMAKNNDLLLYPVISEFSSYTCSNNLITLISFIEMLV